MKSPFLIPALTVALLGSMSANGAERYKHPSDFWERTPADIAHGQVTKLTHFFDLTDAQQKDVQRILTRSASETRTVQAEMQPMRRDLMAEIRADDQDQIRSTMNELAPLMAQMETIRADAAGQIYRNVLTPDQREKVTDSGPLFRFHGHFIPIPLT